MKVAMRALDVIKKTFTQSARQEKKRVKRRARACRTHFCGQPAGGSRRARSIGIATHHHQHSGVLRIATTRRLRSRDHYYIAEIDCT